MSDVTFHQAIKTDQLDEDEALQVIIEGKEVAIINLGGEFYAMDDICSHAYASMADGYLETVSRTALVAEQTLKSSPRRPPPLGC